MGLKIGKNWKRKPAQKYCYDSNIFSENLRNVVTDYSGITVDESEMTIKYVGIVDELPDVNESKYGQLAILNDNKNTVYLFDGSSWIELNNVDYDVRIDVSTENNSIDTYGNTCWKDYYIDNIASVKITKKNYLLSDVNCL